MFDMLDMLAIFYAMPAVVFYTTQIFVIILQDGGFGGWGYLATLPLPWIRY